MGNKNKLKASTPARPATENEFDVRKNLQKLRTGRGTKSSTTTADDLSTVSRTGVTSVTDERRFQTGDLYHLTESIHSRYDKLKDDIGDLKQNVSSQLTDVNKNFLQKNDFYIQLGFVVVCFVTAATIIYYLSYKDLLDTVKRLEQHNIQIDNELKNIENEKQIMKQRIDSITTILKNSKNKGKVK